MRKPFYRASLLCMALVVSCSNAQLSKQSSMMPSLISAQDYKKWNQACAEEMFDQQHIACMDKINLKLDKALQAWVESKVIALPHNEQNTYRQMIMAKQEENKTACWQKMQAFGPGTLNKRRLPLCRNDHKFSLITFIEQSR